MGTLPSYGVTAFVHLDRLGSHDRSSFHELLTARPSKDVSDRASWKPAGPIAPMPKGRHSKGAECLGNLVFVKYTK